MQQLYPVFLQLNDKLCVVAGGGAVAARKVRALLNCGARVRVVSPALCEELLALAREGKLEWQKGLYSEDSLEGAALVFGATDDAAVNRQIAKHCAKNGLPVNIADAPELCSFIVPATVSRGLLTIAVSTGGAAPALARRLCRELEERFGETYGELLAALAEARAGVLAGVKDAGRRRAIFTALAEAEQELLDVAETGGPQALRARIKEITGGVQ